jgi:hypothetical protein
MKPAPPVMRTRRPANDFASDPAMRAKCWRARAQMPSRKRRAAELEPDPSLDVSGRKEAQKIVRCSDRDFGRAHRRDGDVVSGHSPESSRMSCAFCAFLWPRSSRPGRRAHSRFRSSRGKCLEAPPRSVKSELRSRNAIPRMKSRPWHGADETGGIILSAPVVPMSSPSSVSSVSSVSFPSSLSSSSSDFPPFS